MGGDGRGFGGLSLIEEGGANLMDEGFLGDSGGRFISFLSQKTTCRSARTRIDTPAYRSALRILQCGWVCVVAYLSHF